MRRAALAVAAAAIFAALAGCAGEKAPDPLAGLVDLGGVLVAADKAIVEGHVVSDAGLPVPGARISVLGSDLFTDSDARGAFALVNVTAGAVELQATHPSYKAHLHRLEVPAGQRVTANLTLLSLQSAGIEMPHLHDHWGGKETYLLLDLEVDLQAPPQASPYPDEYWAVYSMTYRSNANVSHWPVPFDATPHGGPALVLPGTARMDVTVTWGSDVITEGFGLCFDAADKSPVQCLPPQASPATFSIPVGAAMADSGHQPFSLWGLELYTRPLTQGNGGAPDLVTGDATVQVVLTRGEVLVDPPHPDFWAGGNERLVLEDILIAPSICCSAPTQFYPEDLVPPGTARVRVVHAWAVDGALGAQPLEYRLLVRTAAMNPYTTALAQWTQPEPTAGSADERTYTYEFEVDATEVDGYYQSSSFWRFAVFQPRWGPDGFDIVGTGVTHTMTVTAIRT